LVSNADVYKVAKKESKEVIALTGLTAEVIKKWTTIKGYRQRSRISKCAVHNRCIDS
jgi:hypothetical protein